MKEENGAIMVEASIIFPIVLFTVMSMIYLGLFKLQEAAMLYHVQRVARQGSMLTANPGYQELGIYDTNAVDFTGEPASVDQYYKAYRRDFKTMYREIFGSSWMPESKLNSFAGKLSEYIEIFNFGSAMKTDVTVDRNFFGTSVKAEVRIELKTPGVLKFFGLEDTIVMKQAAYAKAIHPSDFVRNVDLVADTVLAAADLFGVRDNVNSLLDKFDEVTNFLF